ncbi:hypothetical protein Ahy_B09g097479 [Arachis hypogaea]|uniref:Uncharacterized protein n=1 Tax=Arachis hypogaea TaxID=3818 RepID=A0A444XPA1_ARAHY|nr:hypothetical protein Ahy_B09g097479 [Arachis hypogaea]
MQVVALAKLFEEKFAPNTQRWRSTTLPHSATPPKFTFAPTPKPLAIIPTSQPLNSYSTSHLLPTPPKPATMSKLSPMDFRREKGLRFTCDERYSLSHRCAAKHYFLIQSVKELPWEEIVVEENLEIKQPLPVEPDPHEPLHLSYNILTGIPDRRSN